MTNDRPSSSQFVSTVRELSETRRGASWEAIAARVGGASPRWEEAPRQTPRETGRPASRPC